MTNVKNRIRKIKLMEKVQRNYQYAANLGISARIVEKKNLKQK